MKTVLLNAGLLLVYFAAGKFGLAFFALIHPSASAVWRTRFAVENRRKYGLALMTRF